MKDISIVTKAFQIASKSPFNMIDIGHKSGSLYSSIYMLDKHTGTCFNESGWTKCRQTHKYGTSLPIDMIG